MRACPQGSSKPVIYYGGGCQDSRDELREFARKLNIPITSTLMVRLLPVGLSCGQNARKLRTCPLSGPKQSRLYVHETPAFTFTRHQIFHETPAFWGWALTGLCMHTCMQGLGVFPTDDKQSLQMLGMHGTVYANYAIDQADLLIALGVR